MEAICQSYDKFDGKMIKYTLNAAKYQKVNSLMIDVQGTTNHGKRERERRRRRNVDYTLLLGTMSHTASTFASCR